MIALISGTNRPDSNTLRVARLSQACLEAAGAETRLIDLQQLPAELFLPEAYASKPAVFKEAFSDVVLQAEGLVVVTPEYNGGFPGVLKLFIDMLPFPESFEHKPTAFIGVAAGAYGALRPVEQLQQIFGYRNALIYPQRVFVPGVFNKLDASGELADADIQQRLQAQAEGFIKYVSRFQD